MNLPDNAETAETPEAERHASRLEVLDPRAIRFKTLKEEDEDEEPGAAKSFENPLYEEAPVPEQLEAVQVDQVEAQKSEPKEVGADVILVEPIVDVTEEIAEDKEEEWPNTPLSKMDKAFVKQPLADLKTESQRVPEILITAEDPPSTQHTEEALEASKPESSDEGKGEDLEAEDGRQIADLLHSEAENLIDEQEEAVSQDNESK